MKNVLSIRAISPSIHYLPRFELVSLGWSMCKVSRPVCLCPDTVFADHALMVKHTGWLGALAKLLCNDRVKLCKNCKPPHPPYLKTNCGSKSESVGSLNDKVGRPFAPGPWHCRKGQKSDKRCRKGVKRTEKASRGDKSFRCSPSRPYPIYWWLVSERVAG